MGRKKLGETVEIKINQPDVVESLTAQLDDIRPQIEKITTQQLNESLAALAASVPEEVIPARSEPEWNDYVMRQFATDELTDGCPNVHGLRRVVELLIGKVLSCEAELLNHPTIDSHGRLNPVSASCKVVLIDKAGNTLTYKEIADVSPINAKPEFARHPAALAATRAENRALRKLLGIKTVSNEEAEAPPIEEVSVQGQIQETQINFIDMFCGQRLDINVLKFINNGARQYDNINEVSYETAAKMIKVLSEYQQGIKPVPSHIKGYDEDWKKKQL